MTSHLVDAPVRETRMPNGIRVVTEYVPHAYGVAVGLRVDVGSRDESDTQAGISHLLEHMVFKGTERRTARRIAEEMDAVGGQLDAFTTKEYTGYGTRVLPEHVPLAIEIIADMLRNSRFDPDELELEKSVILEEYKSLEDSPEEYVHELFARTLWPSHALGRSVIGSPESIQSFSRDDLLTFLADRYVPDRLICVAAGNLEHDAFLAEIERHFGDLSGSGTDRSLSEPSVAHERQLLSRRIEQAHFCFGTGAMPEDDPDRWPLRVLNLLLGGGMSSRLFQEIREKRGLCYSIASEVVNYREGGVFVVYADTSLEHVEQVETLARKELRGLAAEGLTDAELERAKAQVRAATLLSQDDVGSRMNRIARSLLYQDRVIPLSELVGCVEAVTLEDCRRVAERLFSADRYAYAAIGPFVRRRSRAAAA